MVLPFLQAFLSAIPCAYRSAQVAHFPEQAQDGSPDFLLLTRLATHAASNAITSDNTMMLPRFSLRIIRMPPFLPYLTLTSCVRVSASLYGLNNMYRTNAMITAAAASPITLT